MMKSIQLLSICTAILLAGCTTAQDRLKNAIRDGDTATVRKMIERNLSLATSGDECYTKPLYTAYYHQVRGKDRDEIIAILIDAGADPSVKRWAYVNTLTDYYLNFDLPAILGSGAIDQVVMDRVLLEYETEYWSMGRHGLSIHHNWDHRRIPYELEKYDQLGRYIGELRNAGAGSTGNWPMALINRRTISEKPVNSSESNEYWRGRPTAVLTTDDGAFLGRIASNNHLYEFAVLLFDRDLNIVRVGALPMSYSECFEGFVEFRSESDLLPAELRGKWMIAVAASESEIIRFRPWYVGSAPKQSLPEPKPIVFQFARPEYGNWPPHVLWVVPIDWVDDAIDFRGFNFAWSQLEDVEFRIASPAADARDWPRPNGSAFAAGASLMF